MSITPTDRTLGKSNHYDVVFTDKTDNSTLEKTDFIKLMVAQIQNQDFTNPADASDMLNQMSTLSNMQMMEDMAKYSKQSYAMSMVGKYVTATRNTVSGNADMTTGRVDKVAMVDDEFVFYIGDKTYKMSQIYSAEVEPATEDTAKPDEPAKPDDTTETPEVPDTEKPASPDETPEVPEPEKPEDTEETTDPTVTPDTTEAGETAETPETTEPIKPTEPESETPKPTTEIVEPAVPATETVSGEKP